MKQLFLDKLLPSLVSAFLVTMAACGISPNTSARPLTQDEYLRSRELMVPVQDVARRQLRDTYSAPRTGGRGDRQRPT